MDTCEAQQCSLISHRLAFDTSFISETLEVESSVNDFLLSSSAPQVVAFDVLAYSKLWSEAVLSAVVQSNVPTKMLSLFAGSIVGEFVTDEQALTVARIPGAPPGALYDLVGSKNCSQEFIIELASINPAAACYALLHSSLPPEVFAATVELFLKTHRPALKAALADAWSVPSVEHFPAHAQHLLPFDVWYTAELGVLDANALYKKVYSFNTSPPVTDEALANLLAVYRHRFTQQQRLKLCYKIAGWDNAYPVSYSVLASETIPVAVRRNNDVLSRRTQSYVLKQYIAQSESVKLEDQFLLLSTDRIRRSATNQQPISVSEVDIFKSVHSSSYAEIQAALPALEMTSRNAVVWCAIGDKMSNDPPPLSMVLELWKNSSAHALQTHLIYQVVAHAPLENLPSPLARALLLACVVHMLNDSQRQTAATFLLAAKASPNLTLPQLVDAANAASSSSWQLPEHVLGTEFNLLHK